MKLRRRKIETGSYELLDEQGNKVARAQLVKTYTRDEWHWWLVDGWYFASTSAEAKDAGKTEKLVLAVIAVQDRAEKYGLGKA